MHTCVRMSFKALEPAAASVMQRGCVKHTPCVICIYMRTYVCIYVCGCVYICTCGVHMFVLVCIYVQVVYILVYLFLFVYMYRWYTKYMRGGGVAGKCAYIYILNGALYLVNLLHIGLDTPAGCIEFKFHGHPRHLIGIPRRCHV